MTNSEEIRSVLRAAGEPMQGKAICDALGCETKAERDRTYKTLSAMAFNGNGIESIGDGRYSLTPGWKPKRAKPARLGKVTPPVPVQTIPADDTSGPMPAAHTPATGQQIECGGCAPPVVVAAIEDLILDHFRGEYDADPRELLRDARAEIIRLRQPRPMPGTLHEATANVLEAQANLAMFHARLLRMTRATIGDPGASPRVPMTTVRVPGTDRLVRAKRPPE